MQGAGRRARVDMLKLLGNKTPGTAYDTPFACFSTATIADDASGLAEPTAGTGGYAAQQISAAGGAGWTTPPTPTAGQPAVLANANTISWGPSTGTGWSTGATTLPVVGIFNHVTTRSEAVFIGAMGVTVPRAVNAAGITLESLAGDLQFTLTPT
jgi:hypothetical protein